MTRIDFYILPDQQPAARQQFCCRLTEKAIKHAKSVYIHTNGHEEAEMLDELLWSFREDSFIPHQLVAKHDETPCPVKIGWQLPPLSSTSLLINLTDTVPSFVDQFERVAEIVAGDGISRKTARQNFKSYRDKGYSLHSHNIRS
ncbi:DNA polymerase III subunit chi [Spartinivicinus poritis]|uniref:DNA polymerase III subunit chi n=1 Tax=Spartinivicinus poritis TaxID=2994640 RepID=A0ABT5U621_9GAMM|nr:DNA polymerase III subunit chi [Spartinivicinus sp. A2-2]MDE1460634.1 DNA polymerase III subunit chi [Spartinivicinus sp. A2-2]